MTKSVKISLIVILSIILLTITSGFILLLVNSKTSFSFNNFSINAETKQKLVYSNEFNNEYSKINVNSNTVDVYFIETDSEKIKVEVYGQNEEVNVDEKDGALTINYKEEEKELFSFGTLSQKINVYVPKKLLMNHMDMKCLLIQGQLNY